jgi:Carboxypeptidase regulatory-like domain/TonB dependent receptor-like, beta-barrel
MTHRLTATSIALLMAVLFVAAPLRAQVAQAELRGTVVDESGAALPGVTITATHVDTGAVRTSVSTPTGSFLMPALPVGRYRLRVELTGFSTLVQEDFVLAVGQSAALTFTMKVAAVQETVTVAGQSPLVETKKSELSGVVNPDQVATLPLNGRNWLDLAALVPGARGNPGTIRAGFGGSDMAKYQVDGVDVSSQCCGGANQGYSQENIQEFEVVTNRFDAEYGRVAGLVINAITKSGTNRFRGTGFGFFRDSDVADAKNFFTDKVEPYHEKQVGGNGGGPITRDRVFFFASYEYQKRDITARPATGYAAFDVPVNNGITRHYSTGRVDTQISSKHRAFARASKYNWEQLNVNVDGRMAVSNGYSRPSKNTDLSVGETWVVSDRTVNEVRAGFSAIDNKLVSNSTMPLHTFPSIVIGSPTNSPQWWEEMNIQVNDSLSYFLPSWHGEHTLKTGFQFFRPKFWGAFPSGEPFGGSYTFSTDPADPNNPATYPPPSRYSVTLGDTSYTITNPTYAAFVKDDWIISKNLTLNLGIRYDVETGTINKDLQNPVEPGEKKGDYDNFAPRLGFAYDVRGNARTVVRGGYGRNFDKVLLNITSNERRQILGQYASYTVLNPPYVNPIGDITLEKIKAQNLPRDMIVIANDYRTPTQDQVSIGIAQQIGAVYAAQMDYIHARGFNEPRARRINLFEDPVTHLPKNPTQFGRPYPQFLDVTRYETTAKSEYDGVQVGFQGRDFGPPWNRSQFSGSYTLSWTHSDHENNRFDQVTNPFNLADEWSFSASDQRHRFIINGLSRLPWDIGLSAIFFVGSPRTINTRTNLDPFGSGTGRWLDATGATIGRYSERTVGNDYKLDLRVSKDVRLGQMRLQGLVEAFNILNTRNLTNYNGVYGSRTYLQPANSTEVFYQPRQVQLGFRVSY